MSILNRKMEAITSLRGDLGNVANLWSSFHELMQKTTDGLQKDLQLDVVPDTPFSSGT